MTKTIAFVLLTILVATTIVIPVTPVQAQGGWCLEDQTGVWVDCNPPTPTTLESIIPPCRDPQTGQPVSDGQPMPSDPHWQCLNSQWTIFGEGTGPSFPVSPPILSSQTIGWTVFGEEIKIDWFILNWNGPLFLSTTASAGNPASAVLVAAVTAGSLVWYAYQTQPMDISWGEWLMGGAKELCSSWPQTKWAISQSTNQDNLVMAGNYPPIPAPDSRWREPSQITNTETARWQERLMVWRTAVGYLKNGGPPPTQCGVRADGAIMLLWRGVQITRVTGGQWITGLLIIINPNNFSQSTGIGDVEDPQGEKIIKDFTPIDCNSLGGGMGPGSLIPSTN